MPLSNSVFTKMVGAVVKSLRENCAATRLVSMNTSLDTFKKGDQFTIPFPGPVPQRSVVPANVPPVGADPVNNSVLVTFDNWEEAPFTIGEKDLMALDDPQSFIRRQLSASGRTIANAVDRSIINLYQNSPFLVGTPGTTPFATSTVQLQQAETQLIQNVTAEGDRGVILDPFAYGNAIGLSVLQNNQAFGSEVITGGRVRKALGYDWSYSQNIPTHTRGALGGTPTVTGVQAVGTTSVLTGGWSASVTNVLRRGDIITFAGDPNPYVVTANVSSNGSGVASIPISNGYADLTAGLLIASVNAAAITTVASHKVNLALTPNAAVIASRLPDIAQFVGDKGRSYRTPWVDETTGLAYLFKVTEQHFQVEFSISCLWAARSVWSQQLIRIAG